MFGDESGEGGGVQWQAPRGGQRPQPRKLTGPWGEYSGATVASAPKGPKKKPGESFCNVCTEWCTLTAVTGLTSQC